MTLDRRLVSHTRLSSTVSGDGLVVVIGSIAGYLGSQSQDGAVASAKVDDAGDSRA